MLGCCLTLLPFDVVHPRYACGNWRRFSADPAKPRLSPPDGCRDGRAPHRRDPRATTRMNRLVRKKENVT